VLVPAYCNFFDLAAKEIIKYSDFQDLEQKLRDIFDGAGSVRESLLAAEEYAARYSGPEIASQFIEFFERVRGERRARQPKRKSL
jgi:hypothetical protein